MLKKYIIIFVLLLLLSSCSNSTDKGNIKKVGLLVPETINDQVWGTKGYKGLLLIQNEFDVDVFYREGMNSESAVDHAIKELKQKGVNLIFGNGDVYSDIFNKIATKYPTIHFVSFNGDAKQKNTTSIKFEGHAMGFFGGMTAAHMSKNKNIGIVGAYSWQPEIKGFVEGAKFENLNTDVKILYTENWDDQEKAIILLQKLIDEGIDVVYPAGDGFNVPVIEKVKEKGLYAIGFVSDQSDLGKNTVLTSTVQLVSKLYDLVAKKFANGTLQSGNLSVDFQDGVIEMGKYSPLVDKEFRTKIDHYVEEYEKTGKLPK
ncbi:BMP family ABC transporter substrate-binding protein [Heyndrickxia sp. NPDC080065]|uniref:BMP family ABC transporter substrate-binding protein n=1 Tax=Heyndrickxia sp. NPDC080065 TaxID=3390568 RepID=UPI003D0605E1